MLAFACAFTMFAGAASFTDAADIEATEAVNMLTALGVIEGYEDGSFQPNGVVTRAEMAKMIFVIWNGGEDDASAYQSMNSAFGDTTTHWARGYINFCAANNIIAGVGNNRFNPDATVTGQEAAKMLLTIIGYDEERAGLTGANWAQNTMSYAGLCGLFNDVDSPVEQGLPRQYAAQMIYNALDTNRVKWSTDSNSFDDITSWNGSTFVKETVGERYMGYTTITGILVEANNGDGKGFGILTQDVTNNQYDGTYTWTNSVWSETKYTTDLTQYLGQEVKVAYDADEYNKNSDSVFGVFATDENNVVSSSRNKVKMTSDSTKVKIDGTEYKIDANAKYITTAAVNSSLDDIKSLYSGAPLISSISTNDVNEGTTVKFVDYDNDNKFDLAIEFPMAVGEVSSITSSRVTLKSGTSGNTLSSKSFDLDENNVASDLAKGDIAVVTYDYFNGEYVVAKADVVSSEVTATRSGEYQIDGAWAKVAVSYQSDMPTVKAGDAVDAVIINGIIYYCDKTKGSTGTDVAMVVSTGATTGGADAAKVEAKLMFADGTTKVVTVDQVVKNSTSVEYDADNINILDDYLIDGETVTGDNHGTYANYAALKAAKGPALVTYSNDNEGNYTLQLVDKTNNDADYDDVVVSGDVKDSSGATSSTIYSVGGYEIADDAVVMVTYGTSDAKKLTGKEAKRLNCSALVSAKKGSAMISKESGYNYAKVVALNFTAKPAVTNGAEYGYLLTDAYVGSDKFTYFTMWTQNGYQEVKWDNNTSSNDLKTKYSEKAVITFDYDADGVIKNVEAVSMTKGAITAYNNDDKIDFLSSAGTAVTGAKIDTDDTVILFVDTDDLDANTGSTNEGTMEVADDLVKDVLYTANVMYQTSLTGGATADVIVYDVNGNLNGDDITCQSANLTTDNLDDLFNQQSTVTISNDLGTGTINVPANKTLNINASQASAQTVTVEAGATVKVDASATIAQNTTVTAKPGATVIVAGNREMIGANSLSSNSDISLKVLADNKMEYTLTADATLAGTLEIAGADALKGAYTVTGKAGAVIKVYNRATLTSNEWKLNIDGTADQQVAAGNRYTWNTNTWSKASL